MKNVDRILKEFISEIHQRFGDHLKNIILFGSRARGDHLLDSDYDCLLIFDNVSPLLIDSIDDITADFIYKYNVIISAFPVSEKNYKKQSFNPLFMNIRQDGISL
ncbi:MAG TPA: nucleotidyltransferase domain-containing protein [Candidatus Kapabacteria bacterium]|nr:nucleotidyltransferase domain-containing protein [Candidatus Kapabacteria bacterium]